VSIKATITELTGVGAFFEVEQLQTKRGAMDGYKHAPQTLTEIIQNARGHGDQGFIVSGDTRLTFAEFFDRADRLRAYLQENGLNAGDRFAIAMRNNAEWLVGFTAAFLAGATVVPINSWGQADELAFALQDCGASWLLCDDQRGNMLSGELDTKKRLIVYDRAVPGSLRGIDFNDATSTKAPKEVATPAGDDVCLILYTSGSTGTPKGVVHCQQALSQAVFNMMFTGMLTMTVEGGLRELRGGATQEKALLNVPLFHATGLLGSFVLPLVTAQGIVMISKWDAQEALRLIEAERVTLFSSVPALVKDLLTQPNLANFDISSLHRVSSGGAAMPSDLPGIIEGTIDKAYASGGYGLTETLAVGSQAAGAVFDAKPAAAGVQSPIMAIRCSGADGSVLPPGEAGEIEMRGVACTLGYWNKPEANAAVFTEDGWMKTGDMGYVADDGYVHITGRIKDIVIRGGENIYPGDTEQACYQIDGVQECVVFGVPDELMGEELAMVVRVAASSLSEDDIRAGLKARIAGYKVPKFIELTDQPLARGATEKFDKRAIQAAFIATNIATKKRH
jgi:long-chain acyl-CoA synthetase